jgi:hypothetical protein
MALRASPAYLGRIAMTMEKDTPPDGGMATCSMVGNCLRIRSKKDASNGSCLRMWFSVGGLPVRSA